jgi:hypothetical protein
LSTPKLCKQLGKFECQDANDAVDDGLHFGKFFGFQNFFIKKIESTGIKTSAAYWKLLRGIWTSTKRGRFQYAIRTEELAILWYIQIAVAQCARTGQEGLHHDQKTDVFVLQLLTVTLVFYYLESKVEWLVLLFFMFVPSSIFVEAGYPIYSVL